LDYRIQDKRPPGHNSDKATGQKASSCSAHKWKKTLNKYEILKYDEVKRSAEDRHTWRKMTHQPSDGEDGTEKNQTFDEVMTL